MELFFTCGAGEDPLRRVAVGASGEKGCRDQSQTSSTRGRRESTTAQSEETRDTVNNRERAALDSIVEARGDADK